MMSARRYLPRVDDHETASKTLDRQLLVANRRRHESERFDRAVTFDPRTRCT